jgi:hypothetical protein
MKITMGAGRRVAAEDTMMASLADLRAQVVAQLAPADGVPVLQLLAHAALNGGAQGAQLDFVTAGEVRDWARVDTVLAWLDTTFAGTIVALQAELTRQLQAALRPGRTHQEAYQAVPQRRARRARLGEAAHRLGGVDGDRGLERLRQGPLRVRGGALGLLQPGHKLAHLEL